MNYTKGVMLSRVRKPVEDLFVRYIYKMRDELI
jgi:hypothetical protein